jgi:hypothetical protein
MGIPWKLALLSVLVRRLCGLPYTKPMGPGIILAEYLDQSDPRRLIAVPVGTPRPSAFMKAAVRVRSTSHVSGVGLALFHPRRCRCTKRLRLRLTSLGR